MNQTVSGEESIGRGKIHLSGTYDSRIGRECKALRHEFCHRRKDSRKRGSRQV